MDVAPAPWCYKWVDWISVGGRGTEHFRVQKRNWVTGNPEQGNEDDQKSTRTSISKKHFQEGDDAHSLLPLPVLVMCRRFFGDKNINLILPPPPLIWTLEHANPITFQILIWSSILGFMTASYRSPKDKVCL